MDCWRLVLFESEGIRPSGAKFRSTGLGTRNHPPSQEEKPHPQQLLINTYHIIVPMQDMRIPRSGVTYVRWDMIRIIWCMGCVRATPILGKIILKAFRIGQVCVYPTRGKHRMILRHTRRPTGSFSTHMDGDCCHFLT